MMDYNTINDSKHWRNRAAQMRALSDCVRHIEAQAIMLKLADDYDKLADDYDKLADRADVRSNGNTALQVGK